ncbi:MAG: serine protein kinase RIO [Myxococcales bacterium]|nr:serine protein kinase RIO [Myxococcales bacterium]
MIVPESLVPLVELGIIQEVIRPLLSGKEAQVYVVVSGGKPCVAKVYKSAQNRTFKHRAEYTEGRKVRNSRDQRAIEKRSEHGRAKEEVSWRSSEVDVMHRLHAAGVRVPEPHHFVEGVLIMELVVGLDGRAAPRLAELDLDAADAALVHEALITEVTKMLCAGIVHGDLSAFNVLIAADGPVIIDFPQSVSATENANARKLLLRDVGNLQASLGRSARGAPARAHAEEMWDLFQKDRLTPETRLTGRFEAPAVDASATEVLDLVREARAGFEELLRRQDARSARGG